MSNYIPQSIMGAMAIVAFLVITLAVPGDKGVAYAALSAMVVLIFAQFSGNKTSVENAAKLAKVDDKLTVNNEKTAQTMELASTTKTLVDGRMTQMLAIMEKLSQSNTELAATKAMAEGIAIGQGQTIVEAPARAGLTPPQGTPVRTGDQQ